MAQKLLLTVTAIAEGGFGILLLVVPSLPRALILGVDQSAPAALVFARILGAALVAIGFSCWRLRGDRFGRAQGGLIWEMLFYNASAAAILGYAGVSTALVGVALWPGVAFHAAMAAWCIACLRTAPASTSGTNEE